MPRRRARGDPVVVQRKATTKAMTSRSWCGTWQVVALVGVVVMAVMVGVGSVTVPVNVEGHTAARLLVNSTQQLLRALPAFNVSNLSDLAVVNWTTSMLSSLSWESRAPVGEALRERGLRARHPVFMIPGFTSTGLEIWQAHPCAQKYFRQRLWGTLTMLEMATVKSACWLEHMKLDPSTGRDPEGVRIRPSLGLESADYIFPGYWVWARMIEALAQVGYDPSIMQLVGFDWRLSFKVAEARDRTLTNLKASMELAVRSSPDGQTRCVVMTHSMGSLMFFYFLQWVEAAEPGWASKHIESFVSISGPWLGLPKALSAVVSGEIRDTAQLGPLAPIVDKFYSKSDRADLFRTWGSIGALMPKGGSRRVWKEPFLEFRRNSSDEVSLDMTIEDVHRWLKRQGPAGWYQSTMNWASDTGDSAGQEDDLASPPKPAGRGCPEKDWANPLRCALPRMDNATLFCAYGVGKLTERSYAYTQLNMEIDTQARDDKGLTSGVRLVDGDGTVPLISLGAVCDTWRDKRYNPSARIIVREHRHAPAALDIRGGSETSDHVDILGNYQVLVDSVSIAAGLGNTISDEVISDVSKFKLVN